MASLERIERSSAVLETVMLTVTPKTLVAGTGIEPVPKAYEALMLPLQSPAGAYRVYKKVDLYEGLSIPIRW